MYFADHSLFPDNIQPLIIPAPPFGPQWLPGECDIPLTWDKQSPASSRLLQCRRHDAARARARSANRPGFDQLRPIQLPHRTPQAGSAENDPPGGRVDLVRATYGGWQGQVARLRHAPHAHGAGPEAGIRNRVDWDDTLGRHTSLSA